MNQEYTFFIKPNDQAPFSNHAFYCIGTGRMGLALQKNYHDQLAFVQDKIGFSHIRGHGLFCDDMAIYQTYEEDGVEKTEYNFTYLDQVIDDYLSLSIQPFLELGFTPKKLASGDQTVFYWKGNVTPPKDYDKWADLIQAFLVHLIERYGRGKVVTWPLEVWNEPNLNSFWKDSDMEEYFRLYEVTAKAVKEVDDRFLVGGPAICGVDDERWLREFLNFCQAGDVPIDFVTRHVYTVDAPECKGRYAYQQLRDFQVVRDELDASRSIIDGFARFKGMKMHVTEFNTSYTPNCPLHDTNQNAAYVARLLSFMGDTCASYSYWTFGDVFEEYGVPFTPFHGGFGLVANGNVPKPTFWTFYFFNMLGDHAVLRNEHCVVTRQEDGSLRGVAWNPVLNGDGEQKESQCDREIKLNLAFALDNGEYLVLTERVDEETCNPLATWYHLGSPSNPNKEQIDRIQRSALPRMHTERISVQDGNYKLPLTLLPNAVVYFTIEGIRPQTDRGFDYEAISSCTHTKCRS